MELLPVFDDEDLRLVAELINEFVERTGSVIGAKILDNWDEEIKKFIKVFPHEYKAVLESQRLQKPIIGSRRPSPATTPSDPPKDIEDLLPNPNNLDKVRGFMKYKRIKGYYKEPAGRLNEWGEVYDFKAIKENVRVQATR